MNPSLDLDGLNTRIGRLFMAGMPGPDLDMGTEALIREYALGGIILFSRNIQDPLQLATLCRDLQKMSLQYHGISLFLAVDQEGGRVARLKAPFTEFPGQTEIGKDPDPVTKAKEFARVTAKEMQLVGLNMDLTPVLDVPRGTPEKHLIGRIFGEDAEAVASLGCAVIEELQKNGVMAVAKHFPGLGMADFDPHKQLPEIPLGQEDLTKVDILPFKAAVQAGVTGVMSSHAVYPSLDPVNSATLSHGILTELLRKRLGFEGLILTDDLEMGAISLGKGVVDGAVQAFRAGADILLICQDQRCVLESIGLFRKKLLVGDIELERFRESLDRIAVAKACFLKKRKTVSLAAVKEYFGEKSL
ncbi:MAG: beta-N-acetylhexosaminidase [Desulfatiglandaceae bacterium]